MNHKKALSDEGKISEISIQILLPTESEDRNFAE